MTKLKVHDNLGRPYGPCSVRFMFDDGLDVEVYIDTSGCVEVPWVKPNYGDQTITPATKAEDQK